MTKVKLKKENLYCTVLISLHVWNLPQLLCLCASVVLLVTIISYVSKLSFACCPKIAGCHLHFYLPRTYLYIAAAEVLLSAYACARTHCCMYVCHLLIRSVKNSSLFFLPTFQLYPTDPCTIFLLHDPSFDSLEIHKIRRFPDLAAQKL